MGTGLALVAALLGEAGGAGGGGGGGVETVGGQHTSRGADTGVWRVGECVIVCLGGRHVWVIRSMPSPCTSTPCKQLTSTTDMLTYWPVQDFGRNLTTVALHNKHLCTLPHPLHAAAPLPPCSWAAAGARHAVRPPAAGLPGAPNVGLPAEA